MRNAEIKVEDLGNIDKDRFAIEAAKNAIYVENAHSESVYSVTLSGTYERKYYFVTELSAINTARVLLDGDKLIVCLWSYIVIIDLPKDKIRKKIAVTPYLDMFGIYKFKDGYFVYGEMTNRYFDSNFELLWEASGRDIFYCPTRENSLEIFDDHIDVWDFLGYKYTYDELGPTDAYWRTISKKHNGKE